MGHIWEIVPAQRRFQHAVALCPGSGREVESPLRLTSRAVHGARSGGRDRRRRAAVSAVVLTNAYQPPPPPPSYFTNPFSLSVMGTSSESGTGSSWAHSPPPAALLPHLISISGSAPCLLWQFSSTGTWAGSAAVFIRKRGESNQSQQSRFF